MRFLITCIFSSVLLVGCGGSETPPSAPPPESTPEVEPAKKAAVELTPVERGKKLYTRCRACHTLEQDGRHKVGPNLWDVYGAKTGSKEDYAYSKAMKAADIVWDDETMDAYLTKPAAYMPGNKMVFIGLKKQADRDAIQAYVKSKTAP